MRISSTLFNSGGNFARPTKFTAIITLPNRPAGEKLDVLCKSVQIPAVQNDAQEIKIKGHPIKIPKRTIQTQELQVVFYLDELYDLRSIFQNWIHSLDDRNPVARNAETAGLLGHPYAAGTIEIIGRDFDESSNVPVSFLFERVFPTNIGDTSFDSSNKDTISELSVTFGFTRYTTATTTSVESIENLDNNLERI